MDVQDAHAELDKAEHDIILRQQMPFPVTQGLLQVTLLRISALLRTSLMAAAVCAYVDKHCTGAFLGPGLDTYLGKLHHKDQPPIAIVLHGEQAHEHWSSTGGYYMLCASCFPLA